MTIGEKLKKSRNDKGMSLRELATKVELSASFLSQIEQGKASPSIENLKKIAHTLDVRVAYLIEDEEDDIRNIEHIKKENIGLIEAMGLAILPPRLKTELEEVEKYLLGKENAIADYHLEWADQLKEKYPNVKEEEINSVVQHEVGQVFARVLEDAGVYKNTPSGHEAFMRFVKSVGIN